MQNVQVGREIWRKCENGFTQPKIGAVVAK
jgi:hypothetical protein